MAKRKNGGNPLGGVYQPPATAASSEPPAPATPDEAFQAAVAGARTAGTAYRYMDQQWQRSNYAWSARYARDAAQRDALNDFNRQQDEARPEWAKWLDDHFPDNAGGAIVDHLPEQVKAPVRAGTAVFGAAYDWASTRSSQALTWGLSAAPGGTATVDWDTAARISPGRMRVAMGVERRPGVGSMPYYNYMQEQQQVRENFDAAVKAGDPGVITGSVPAPAGPGEKPIVVSENWDITKPEDEAFLFGNSPALNGGKPVNITSPQMQQANIESGLSDAVATWYVDPLFVAGKGVKIYRVGSDMLGIAGRMRRQTYMAQVQSAIKAETDSALQHYASQGTQGSRNHVYTWGENISRRSGDELQNEPWAQGPHKTELLNIADQIHDTPTAIKFLAAASGNKQYADTLRNEAQAVSDALESIGTQNPYHVVQLNAPIGGIRPVILDDVLESGYSGAMIFDDMLKRNAALRDAVNLLETTYQPIQTVGRMHGSLLMTEVAQSWRASKGAAAMRRASVGQHGPAAAPTDMTLDMGDVTAETMQRAGIPGTVPGISIHGPMQAAVTDIVKEYAPNRVANAANRDASPIVETVFNAGTRYRNIRVWNWINTQRSSGWITIRGYDKYDSEKEWESTLTDSKALRNSGTFVQDLIADWRAAVSPEDKLRLKTEIESRAVSRIAGYYGVDEQLAQQIWSHVNKQRQELLDVFARKDAKGRAFGVDPTNGSVIYLSPIMRSQLDTMVPLLDFRLLDKTVRNLKRTETSATLKAMSGVMDKMGKGVTAAQIAEAGTDLEKGALWALESLNSTWKATVLFRLGYTQRNTLEGWLRTAAVLGTVPALAPSAVARGAARVAVTNPRAKRIASKTRKAEAQAADILERNRADILTLDDDIAAYIRAIGGVPTTALHTQQYFHLNNLRAVKAQLEAENVALEQTMARLRTIRETRGKKKYIGWDEAYAGEQGEGRRLAASNQRTQDRFFQSRAAARAEMLRLEENNYGPVAPGAPQYWQELEQAVGQMRADTSMRKALAGATADDLYDWMKGTDEGRVYARDMGLATDAETRHLAATQWAQANAYLPTPEARALALAGDEVPTASQLRGVLGGRDDLATIHGREVAHSSLKLRSPVAWTRDKIFHWLGTLPDSALVRQPYYNSVWKSEYARLWRSAADQGYDMNDAKFLKRINDTAHSRALKSTNDTLFTLTRYSNPASVFRFISPFFAAWENSMRTWLGIIGRDPSVAYRAGVLWNLPNSLGMVVDKNGNTVKGSNLLSFLDGGEDHYVVLPEPVAKVFESLSGGMPFKVPKGALNVVAPGETPFLPGLGPLVTYPFGRIMEGRPDEVEFLKRALGPTLFNQLAPFGQVSGDVMDTVAPAAVRKGYTLWRGTDSPDYMATLDAITVDELVSWELRGGNMFDLPKAADIKARTDAFYKFSMLGSLALPFSTTRMSQYQPQIDYWRSLSSDPSMTYREKVAKFHAKWGTDSYDPLISSTSTTGIKGLDASLPMFQMLEENKDLVEQITADYKDPAAASVLAATVGDGPWSGAVYQWMKNTKQPGTNDTYRYNKDSGSIVTEQVLRDMWSEYMAERDMRDQGLAILGVKSIDSKAAEDSGIAARWDAANERMHAKYQWVWESYGPKSRNFSEDMGRNLSVVSRLLKDDTFMQSDLGRSPVWQGIKAYMEERQLAQDAIRDGSDPKAVKEKFLGFSQAWRWSSLKFADFWDQYLADDDLSMGIN